MEVPWKSRWSAVEVPLKCLWSANSQQPTATSTHLPKLNPPLSKEGWFKTARINNLWQKLTTFLWKLWHHRPISGLRSLTRGLYNTWKWMLCHVTNIQTYGLTSQLYDWISQVGQFSDNFHKKKKNPHTLPPKLWRDRVSSGTLNRTREEKIYRTWPATGRNSESVLDQERELTDTYIYS